MSIKDYQFFYDPREVEYYIEILVEYIQLARWDMAHEEVDLHINVMKKQLQGMGGDYELLADLFNCLSDAPHMGNLSKYNLDPYIEVLRYCYALRENILPSYDKIEGLEYARKLEMAEKAAVLEFSWFGWIKNKGRAEKAGIGSVIARRKKNEARDKALIDKAIDLISNGTKPHEVIGIMSSLEMAAGLSKKQIRNILQRHGVLEKRKKGK